MTGADTAAEQAQAFLAAWDRDAADDPTLGDIIAGGPTPDDPLLTTGMLRALLDQLRDASPLDTDTRLLRADRDSWRILADRANARAEQAEAKLAHAESVVEAFHAEADRLSDRLDTAHDDIQRYRTANEQLRARIAELSEPEAEYRFLLADGTESEFDVHNGPCDCQRQVRVGDGPWLAAGGWVSADAAPLEPGPAAFTLPPREALERLAAEQGVRPVIHIDDLAAAPEDRPSDGEVKAFLFALRKACGTELDDLDILLAALMRRLGDEVELSQDEIEDARRRLRDEEWHFVAFRATFLAPDLVTVKLRSRPRREADA